MPKAREKLACDVLFHFLLRRSFEVREELGEVRESLPSALDGQRRAVAGLAVLEMEANTVRRQRRVREAAKRRCHVRPRLRRRSTHVETIGPFALVVHIAQTSDVFPPARMIRIEAAAEGEANVEVGVVEQRIGERLFRERRVAPPARYVPDVTVIASSAAAGGRTQRNPASSIHQPSRPASPPTCWSSPLPSTMTARGRATRTRSR